jgi:hypothetical protein
VKIEPAGGEDLAELATWRYETPYDFYNGGQEPVKNPERYFIARDDDRGLVGFYYFEPKDDALEYGLGLRPDLTGSGLGLEFFRRGSSLAASRTSRHAFASSSQRSTSARSRFTSAPAFARPIGTCGYLHAGAKSSS